MKPLLILLSLSFSLSAIGGQRCGSKEGYLNQLASSFLIPDNFPPENPLLHTGEFRFCGEDYGTTYLGAGCYHHDNCYETLGAAKSSCDASLQDNWVKACKYQYPNRGSVITRAKRAVCREACTGFVKAMSEAQRFNTDGYCPSCEAYQDAQAVAAEAARKEVPTNES